MENFVIGTGRCGSTLLSTLLSMHPDALVLSEYLSSCHPEQGWPSTGNISGQEFAGILTRFNGIVVMYLNRDILFPEILGDMEAEKDPNKKVAMIPTAMLTAMPFLSKDPAALLQEVVAQSISHPEQTLRQHFLDINDWLRKKFNKSFWIERSGMSTNMFREIRAVFPDARFVHIYRDGEECALSMRDLIDTQIKVSYNYDPPSEAELKQSLNLNLSKEDDPICRRIDNLPPVEEFGSFWSYGIEKFYAEMPYLRPEQLLTVKYENLLNNPRETLERIAAHFNMPERDGWIEQAEKYIRLPLKTRADKLPAEDRKRLTKACEAGNILLGEDRGWASYLDSTLRLEELVREQHK